MGQRRGQTDLSDGDDADQEAEDARSVHDGPENGGGEGFDVLEDDASLESENQRDEQDRRVHVVLWITGELKGYVKAQLPAVVVDDGDHLLGVDAVQGDEEGGQNAEDGTDQGEIDLSVRADVKAKDYDGTARDDCQRGLNPEEQVTERMMMDRASLTIKQH